jgi:molybdate transport system substrate-binding protein
MIHSKTTGQALHIMSGLAVRAAFDSAIVPKFEAETGCKVKIDWLPTTLIMQKVPAGEVADILVLVRSAMDQLVEQGFADASTRAELVHSRVGLAVRAGAPHPDISTMDAFRDALLAARSVVYSRAGASGIHFETVLEKLGIADEVRARATVIPAGFTAEKLVTGEADLAIQQVSELMVVPGIEIVGRFPDAVQTVTSFSAALMPNARNEELARAFMASLQTPEAVQAYRAGGVDPAF